jgi:hypothetical protein
MNHVRVFAACIIVALACVVFSATSVSQIQGHDHQAPPPKHHVIKHHRNRERISFREPVRQPVRKVHPERPHQRNR